jgi:hypothetical protein
MVLWYSLLYLPLTLIAASRRHLWNDELFTYYIARIGSIDGIHDALLTAADQNPPPFYWFSYLGMSFDPGTLGIRVPAIVGVWLLGVCLILWFSRYGLPIYGLVAALFALSTGVHDYAIEARPYGLVVGLAALALVCWQQAMTGRWKLLCAIGLAASLAGAMSSHYYAVLLFPPFFLAECAFVWQNRKVRWPVLAALTAGALPLLFWLPYIQAARTYSSTFWAKASASSVPEYYGFILIPALVPLMAFVVVAGVRHLRRQADTFETFVPSLPEMVCVLSLSAMPVIAVALGRFITGAYTHRYVIFAAIGIVIFLMWLLVRAFGARTMPALLSAGLLTMFILAREGRSMRSAGQPFNRSADIRFLTEKVPAGEIAIADPHLFFELNHQAPPALRSRIYYIADRAAAFRNVGTDAVDRGVLDMKNFAGLRVRGLNEILDSKQEVPVYGYPAYWVWLVAELQRRGIPMTITAASDTRLLLMVQR